MGEATDKFKALWADKPNRDKAIEFAIDFVKENRSKFDFYDGKNHDTIVGLITHWRQQGLDEDSTLATMFELAKFPRQNIGGELKIQPRPDWV